jgi:type IV pilus assembly protein PilO
MTTQTADKENRAPVKQTSGEKRASFQQGIADWTQRLATPLNLHYAGVAALVLLNLYLLAHMAFAWQTKRSGSAEAVAQQTVLLRTAEIAAKPLEGLDAKLTQATAEADKFYTGRLPRSDSEVAGELGVLLKRQGVRLIRVQYAHAAVLPGSAGELTELNMDASLSGDYRPLVEFINALERDKMFFAIRGVSLTGQQSGTVNLRLRLMTYLRARVVDDPAGATGAAAVSSTPAPDGGSAR